MTRHLSQVSALPSFKDRDPWRPQGAFLCSLVSSIDIRSPDLEMEERNLEEVIGSVVCLNQEMGDFL